MTAGSLESTSPDEFPGSAYRGFTQRVVQPDGTIMANAFDFKEFDNRGVEECSINWNDDAGALMQLASQEKDDGSKQFKFGACRIPRSSFDYARSLASATAFEFGYERRPIDGNDYHGNLLCKTGLNKASKRMLCGMLAMMYDELYSREDLDRICSGEAVQQQAPS